MNSAETGRVWVRDGWYHANGVNGPKDMNTPELQVALLSAIYTELKNIRTLAECRNVAIGFRSMAALERLAREFWVKPRRKKKAKRTSHRKARV